METPHNDSTPRNDFKAFAVDSEANVIGQADYEQLVSLKRGFKRGLARSAELNKALRQSSSMAAAVARFTADKTGEAVLDNGDVATLSRQLETAIATVSPRLIAEAAGTADAISAAFSPALAQLVNGLPVYVRAAFKNTTVSLTFQADATGAKPVVKGNNCPLAVGDVAGPGHWLALQYDAGLDKWVLQNPATGVIAGGVPVGSVDYFAMETPPVSYLKADGSAVGRETYPDLFAAIGTTFGEGDGETTFNLPDLIGRFAEGSAMPGVVKEAGLPDIEGNIARTAQDYLRQTNGTFVQTDTSSNVLNAATNGSILSFVTNFKASRSNSIYGASDTVQPPALTLLPCIKAFDSVVDPGLIDVSQLAQAVAGKLDKSEKTPVGTVIAAAGNVTPDGYLYCNGAALNPTAYPELFAVIGTAYGGDGMTAFNLPDYRNRWMRGHDSAGAVVSPGLPNITGKFGVVTSTEVFYNVADTTGAFRMENAVAGMNSRTDQHGGIQPTFDASRSNPIYGASGTVQPPSLTVRYCIKY